MLKNIVVNTIVGAVVVFILSSIWHVATPLGEVGVQNLPNEGILAPALKLGISQPGFYYFPGINMTMGGTKDQQQAEQARYAKAYRQGPTGILIYTPGGEDFQFGKLLVNQFLISVICAFLIALILGLTPAGTTFGQRAGIAVLVSVFGALLISAQYWNWYNFPTNYTVAYAAGLVVTWGLTGILMAWIAGRGAKRA